eukprot:1197442-Ditylum_brightwellii.AAC.1
MLNEALPCWLLAEIEDRETGLNTMSIHNILDHAFDCMGQIDADLVDEYTNTYNSLIDMSKGFNTCRAIHLKYPTHCKRSTPCWTNRPLQKKYLTCKCKVVTMKTWNDFKTYWNREFSDYNMLNKLTSCEAGFGANAT